MGEVKDGTGEKGAIVADDGWSGWRVLLNCGHYTLAASDFQGRIGQLMRCEMCPPTTRNPHSPGLPVAAIRVIVGFDRVTASRPPEPWGPEHWYGA